MGDSTIPVRIGFLGSPGTKNGFWTWNKVILGGGFATRIHKPYPYTLSLSLSLSRTFVSKSHASVRPVKGPAGCLRANWPLTPELKKVRQPKRLKSARCSKLFRKVRQNARRNIKTARNPRANKPRPQHRSRRGTANTNPRRVGQSLAQGANRPSPSTKQRRYRGQHKEKGRIIVQHNPLTLIPKGR